MVRPRQGRSDEELLAWVSSIVRREQDRGTYGTVKVQMEAGRVVRVQIESSELPPDGD